MERGLDTRGNVNCVYFLKGVCKNGDACPFLHDKNLFNIQQVQRKSTPCVFYQRGLCTKGVACPFSHDSAAQPSSAPVTLKVASSPNAPARTAERAGASSFQTPGFSGSLGGSAGTLRFGSQSGQPATAAGGPAAGHKQAKPSFEFGKAPPMLKALAPPASFAAGRGGRDPFSRLGNAPGGQKGAMATSSIKQRLGGRVDPAKAGAVDVMGRERKEKRPLPKNNVEGEQEAKKPKFGKAAVQRAKQMGVLPPSSSTAKETANNNVSKVTRKKAIVWSPATTTAVPARAATVPSSPPKATPPTTAPPKVTTKTSPSSQPASVGKRAKLAFNPPKKRAEIKPPPKTAKTATPVAPVRTIPTVVHKPKPSAVKPVKKPATVKPTKPAAAAAKTQAVKQPVVPTVAAKALELEVEDFDDPSGAAGDTLDDDFDKALDAFDF